MGGLTYQSAGSALTGYVVPRYVGFALTGYVVPGCVEDGAWMLWGNHSVAAAAAVAFARSF